MLKPLLVFSTTRAKKQAYVNMKRITSIQSARHYQNLEHPYLFLEPFDRRMW